MQRKPKQQPFSSIFHDCYNSVVDSIPSTPHACYGHGCWIRTVLFSGHVQQICSWLLAIKNTIAKFFSTAHCAFLCHLPLIACFHFQTTSHDVLTFSHLALPVPASHWEVLGLGLGKSCVLSHLFSFRYSPKSLPNHFILCSQMLSWGMRHTAIMYVLAPPFVSAHFLSSVGLLVQLLAPWDRPHCSNHENCM